MCFQHSSFTADSVYGVEIKGEHLNITGSEPQREIEGRISSGHSNLERAESVLEAQNYGPWRARADFKNKLK